MRTPTFWEAITTMALLAVASSYTSTVDARNQCMNRSGLGMARPGSNEFCGDSKPPLVPRLAKRFGIDVEKGEIAIKNVIMVLVVLAVGSAYVLSLN